MTKQRKNLGKIGEQLAKKLLLSKNYKFLIENFTSKLGEIDLIFLDKKTLVFVEVKTRFYDEFGAPEEAVTERKIRTIKRVVDFFYCRYPKAPKLCRIDVVAIALDPATLKPTYVRHIENVTG